MAREGRWPALRVAGVYLVVGAAWIAFSDTLVDTFVPAPLQTRLQTFKGFVFVGLSATLIFFLVAGELKRRREAAAERLALEQQLQQAQKMEAVGRLAGGVAHDFNNVLTVILGAAHSLLDDPTRSDTTRALGREIVESAERASRITRQLTALGRDRSPALEPVDMDVVVGELRAMLHRLMPERINLVMRLESDGSRVLTNRSWVEQILMNLALNARDAMPGGGELTIETQVRRLSEAYVGNHANVRPGSYLLLSVSDTGTGMTPEVRDRLFEPFFTTKGAGEGTGLGLATVYSIVQKCGGHIRVYSEPGRGSTFRIHLPLTEQENEGEDAKSAQVAAFGDRATVLVVEDEEAVRNLVERVLRRAGYRVLVTCDGASALDVFDRKSGGIHLVLADMGLPDLNGVELRQQAARRGVTAPFLFMSGFTESTVRSQLGDAAFIEKPFVPGELLERIGVMLGGGPPNGDG